MTRIPTAALILGAAGLIPFVASAAGVLSPALAEAARVAVSPEYSHRAVMAQYAVVILAFMAGVIWGFAARAGAADAARGYAMAVTVALWAFAVAFLPLRASLAGLALGFAALLPVDLWAVRRGLAPGWWMRLRAGLTAVVIPCLVLGALS